MRFRNSRGFTLIELLVVISIIGMLSSVVLASVQTARDKGRVAAGITFGTHNLHALGADAIAFWNFDQSIPCRKIISSIVCVFESLGNGVYLKTYGSNSLVNSSGLSPYYLSSNTPLKKGYSGIINSTKYFAHTPTSNLDRYLASQNLTPKKITISAWINLADVQSSGSIISVLSVYDPYGENSIGILAAIWLDEGKFICNSDMFTAGQVIAGVQQPNTWQQITCSFDGVSGNIAGYLDGKKVGDGQFVVNQNFFDVYGPVQRIGVGTSAENNPPESPSFTGLIDDVAVYAGAL